MKNVFNNKTREIRIYCCSNSSLSSSYRAVCLIPSPAGIDHMGDTSIIASVSGAALSTCPFSVVRIVVANQEEIVRKGSDFSRGHARETYQCFGPLSSLSGSFQNCQMGGSYLNTQVHSFSPRRICSVSVNLFELGHFQQSLKYSQQCFRIIPILSNNATAAFHYRKSALTDHPP